MTVILLAVTMALSSCGFNSSLTSNLNTTSTDVQLNKKNYKVIERVKGQSTAIYIFGFGGLKNKSLLEQAKSNMMKNADIGNDI